MDKELKKAIKRFLLLDSLFSSSSSVGSIFDEIEDELEEMFGGSQNKNAGLMDWFKSSVDDDENS